MEILRAAVTHAAAGRLAVLSEGITSSYAQLLQSSEAILSRMAKDMPARPNGSPNGPRIGVFAAPGHQYVASTWATWMAGGVAVPLAVSHPPAELEYVLQDAGVSAVLVPEALLETVKGAAHNQACKVHALEDSLFPSASSSGSSSGSSSSSSMPEQTGMQHGNGSWPLGSTGANGDGALIIYTSGTTGRPKGALHTQGSLMAQVKCLVKAWHWAADDRILHALPLHHTHGIINALHCAHYAGAAVDFLPKFSPIKTWQRLQEGDTTVLMAVPTMYNYLLSTYDSMSPADQASAAKAAAALRLTVSGSAACPIATMQRWQHLSGQVLLERYGMTETGMLLSNPYEGERRQGFVGLPLPGVHVRIAPDAEAPRGVPAAPQDTSSHTAASADTSDAADPSAAPGASSNSRGPVAAEASSGGAQGTASQGELRVAGDMLFKEYWNRPEATAEAFDVDGYFKTGDIVSLEGSTPYFRIMGRASVDIIKSGGYKISGLDIENTLCRHPAVVEAAVLGVADNDLGEVVAALVVAKAQDGSAADSTEALQEQLAAWCKAELPPYQVPRVWRFLDALPRNAMGKVNKKQLKKDFF